MSKLVAQRLSKDTGLNVEWNSKGGYFVLTYDGKQWFPLYSKERLLMLVDSLREKK